MFLKVPMEICDISDHRITCSNVFVSGRLDGASNMRLDLELLDCACSVGQTLARLYEWDGIWVSLGRSQDVEEVLVNSKRFHYVVRPTGGGAVLHGHDLTVSIATPVVDDERRIRPIYRKLVMPIVRVLNFLGKESAISEDFKNSQERLALGDCFSSSSVHDIVCKRTGRKLAGCALRVTHSGSLVQISIPVTLPVVDPAEVFYDAHTPDVLGVDIGVLKSVLELELLNSS